MKRLGNFLAFLAVLFYVSIPYAQALERYAATTIGPDRTLLSGASTSPAVYADLTNGQLPNWLSYSSASNKLANDSNGNLVYAPNNLLLQSQSFSNGTNWSQTSATITDNVTTAPDGTSSASSVVLTASGGGPGQGNISTGGTRVAFQVYAKAFATNWVRLRFGSTDIAVAYVNVATGATGTSGGTGSVITSISFIPSVSVGNGWYRVGVVLTLSTAVTNLSAQIIPTAADNTQGAATNSAYLWGAQLALITPAQSDSGDYKATTTAAYYGPRFDNQQIYSSGNLLLQSADPTNAVWTKGQLTTSFAGPVDPFGSTPGKLTESTSASQFHFWQQSFSKSVSAGQRFIASFYVYPNGRQVSFTYGDFGANGVVMRVDPADGSIKAAATAFGTYSSPSGGVIPAGNGWYRVWVSGMSGAEATTGLQVALYSVSAGSAVYTGDGSSGVYVSAPQLEQASAVQGLPSNYNATTTSAVQQTIAQQPMGLLLEGARTNSIRNNTMVGAVAGTPGTAPTNWTRGTANNISIDVVGTGTESGISYIDLRFSGTPNATGSSVNFRFEPSTQITAATGQFWAFSAYLKLVAGSFANTTLNLQLGEWNSGGTFLTGTSTSITPTSAALSSQRYTQVRSLNQATTASVSETVYITYTNLLAVDFTLRVGLPQIEQLAASTQTASSPILTTGTALTRAADIATIVGAPATILAAGEGSVLVETTQYVGGQSGITARLIGATSGVPIFISGTGTIGGNGALATATAPAWTTGVRAALAYNSSGRSIAGTGVTLVSDTNPMGGTGTFYLGSANGTTTTDGWYTRAAFWSKRLPDAELTRRVNLSFPLNSAANDNIPDWLKPFKIASGE